MKNKYLIVLGPLCLLGCDIRFTSNYYTELHDAGGATKDGASSILFSNPPVTTGKDAEISTEASTQPDASLPDDTPPIDQDPVYDAAPNSAPDTAPVTQGPCELKLLSPAPGASLDNGRTDDCGDAVWAFEWSACEGDSGYELVVRGTDEDSPIIKTVTDRTEFRYDIGRTPIVTTYQRAWTWQVRARNGKVLSEMRTFDVRPIDSAPPKVGCGFEFCPLGVGSTDTEGCCAVGNKKFPTGSKPQLRTLIKGTTWPLVFYLGSNDKRYVFPTREPLISWYEQFDSDNLLRGTSGVCGTVQEFPDDVVNGIPLVTNVTIRPGAYLVRLSYKSEVYAVSRLHELREIGSQIVPDAAIVGPLAELIYPATSLLRVRVVPVAFFGDYSMGKKLGVSSDFDPATEWDWGAPSTLERELGIVH